MHSVSANYTLPTVLNSLQPVTSSTIKKNASASTTTTGTTGTQSSSSSSSANNSASSLSSTFLNLLAQELQNQDPTAPVDSTAMVGQMISLNQLDQLISINQGITGATSAATDGTSAAQSPYTTDSAAALASTSGVTGMLSPSTAAAATSQLPFDPNTMMPLAAGNSGAIAATINSSLSAANLGLSGTNNNSSNNTSSGGK
jgi:flagellar basal-body rod modification protein FlgD